MDYKMGRDSVCKAKEEKDLGIIVHNDASQESTQIRLLGQCAGVSRVSCCPSFMILELRVDS